MAAETAVPVEAGELPPGGVGKEPAKSNSAIINITYNKGAKSGERVMRVFVLDSAEVFCYGDALSIFRIISAGREEDST